MKDRETARMRKYGESKTTRIMMATVPHVTSGLGLRKFQADGFLLTRVYLTKSVDREGLSVAHSWLRLLSFNCASLDPDVLRTLLAIGLLVLLAREDHSFVAVHSFLFSISRGHHTRFRF